MFYIGTDFNSSIGFKMDRLLMKDDHQVNSADGLKKSCNAFRKRWQLEQTKSISCFKFH